MKYDFDTTIDRIETRSTKWLKFEDPNILPMWIADMDFQCPPEVIEAIKNVQSKVFLVIQKDLLD